MQNYVRVISQDKLSEKEISFLKQIVEKFSKIEFVFHEHENDSCIFTFNIKNSLAENQMEYLVKKYFERYDREVFFENSIPATDMDSDTIEDMMDDLAKYMHNHNVREKFNAGWRYGENFSMENKTSPLLVPYENLPDDQKTLRPDIFVKVLDIVSKSSAFEKLTESVIVESNNYDSMFKPILDFIKKYGLENALPSVSGSDKLEKDIVSQISNIKSLTTNNSWRMYLVSVLRAAAANIIVLLEQRFKQVNKIIDPKDIQRMKKIAEGEKNYRQLEYNFRHYSGIQYHKIQKYNPIGKTGSVVLSDLEALEQEYLENVGESDRFVALKEGDKIIKDYGNGYVWMMLSRAYCSDEADAMGHCGNQGGDRANERILSFRKQREVNGEMYFEPFMTFIWNQSNGLLGERKGRANEKPVAKYHPYIIDLLKMNFIKGWGPEGYKPENNFSLNDLNDAQKQEVLEANPLLALYPGVILKGLLDKPKIVEQLKEKHPPTKLYNKIWFDGKNLFYNADIESFVDSSILKVIDDLNYNFYFDISNDEIVNTLRYLDEKNVRKLYDEFIDEIETEDSFEEFYQKIKRGRFDDYFDEDEGEYIDDSPIFERLKEVVRYAMESAAESEIQKGLVKDVMDKDIDTMNGRIYPYGFFTKDKQDNRVYDWIGSDTENVVLKLEVYYDEDEVYEMIHDDISVVDQLRDPDFDPRDTLNDSFADYF